MTTTEVCAVLLVALPILFNLFFFLLDRQFEYPEILRKPVDHVLRRFLEGGSSLKLTWLGFALTAVLFAPAVVLLHEVLAPGATALLAIATTFGVLAAIVQFLGLVRWPFLVPYLARTHEDPTSSAATKDAAAIVFESFNRYAGVAVGEHLGYLFTGIWTSLIGVVIVDTPGLAAWIGIVGIVLGLLLVFGALEFVGPNEERGFALAATVVPIAYIAWSVWLVVLGLALVL